MRPSRMGTVGVPAAVVTIVVTLVIPLPTFLLDVLITLNISFAVLVLLISMHVKRPLDFSVFPSVVLVSTMFRLALNVSATRLVLLHGYAGRVIQSFGHFVVGGSLIVGLVVFLILIVIQFVVITNGAGRVAEVAARFTLDAMPGKQMAIDADLNAGLINETEARRRRAEISAEADFYGAMDGASKFVKGDAVAAIIITLINLIGGFTVGVVQRHLPISDAMNNYSLLSVGDGLVSQIPALLLSVSTGLVATRSATDNEFGSDLIHQLSEQAGAVRIAGVVMCALALIPGLPTVPFLVVGGTILLVGRRSARRRSEAPAEPEPVVPEPAADTPEALAGEMRVEALELEVAYDLVDLVDPKAGGELLARVKGLRRKVASELGLVIPSVRTRDNVSLPAGTYVVRLYGVEVARGTAPAGRVLAIGDAIDGLPGEPTREPVFGLAARWVPAELRDQAVMAGATVVDRASVITTHLAEVVRVHAGRLLTRQLVKSMVDVARATDPVVVDELGTAQVSLGDVQQVLRSLLDEEVPVRDTVRILEAVCERAAHSRDHEGLVEAARAALGPTITSAYVAKGTLPVITIDAAVEQSLVEALRPGEDGSVLAIDPQTAERLAVETGRLAESAEEAGRRPVLVCSTRLRPAMARLLRAAHPRLPVVSVAELGPQIRPDRIGVVSLARAEAI